jgi:hypothetical protein
MKFQLDSSKPRIFPRTSSAPASRCGRGSCRRRRAARRRIPGDRPGAEGHRTDWGRGICVRRGLRPRRTRSRASPRVAPLRPCPRRGRRSGRSRGRAPVVAQHFVDRAGHQLRVTAHHVPLVGVVREYPHRVASAAWPSQAPTVPRPTSATRSRLRHLSRRIVSTRRCHTRMALGWFRRLQCGPGR